MPLGMGKLGASLLKRGSAHMVLLLLEVKSEMGTPHIVSHTEQVTSTCVICSLLSKVCSLVILL